MLVKVARFRGSNKLSNVARGIFRNASSVGANTVYGPGPRSVSTRSPFGCDPPKLTVAAATAKIKTREIKVVLRIMTL